MGAFAPGWLLATIIIQQQASQITYKREFIRKPHINAPSFQYTDNNTAVRVPLLDNYPISDSVTDRLPKRARHHNLHKLD